VRIELEKHYQPRYEVTDLEESEQTDNIIIEDSSYAQLRERQNKAIQAGKKQLGADTLI